MDNNNNNNNNEENPIVMTVGLNAVKHLGKNLYSSTAAALSELVANGWDAYADLILIDIASDYNKITIQDDGLGMDLNHINKQYGVIGQDKDINSVKKPSDKENRKIMGKKGIGKLASFYIGNVVKVITKRKDSKPIGFTMLYNDMITVSEEKYKPSMIDDLDDYVFPKDQGTIIEITDINSKVAHQTVSALKVRIARRFGILSDITIKLNKEKITVEDRKYAKKVEYLWKYNLIEHKEFSNSTKIYVRDNKTKFGDIKGWIGTVKSSGDIKDSTTGDNLNRIVLLINGKVADEDLLMKVNHKGLSTGYIIGVLEADYLADLDDEVVISSRQGVDTNKEEIIDLLEFVLGEIKTINKEWTKLRNQNAIKEAKSNYGINEWYKTLKPKEVKKVDKLFGTINNLKISNDKKKDFFMHSALAFENLKIKDNLELIEEINSENIQLIHKILSNVTDIQKTSFYDSMSTRIQVIEKLIKLNEKNALEKEVQTYIYDNLWLLNPTWDREEKETPHFEKSLKKAFNDINKVIPKEDLNKRIDIYHKSPYRNHHVIIELKRPSVKENFDILFNQINKYQDALARVLADHHKGNETIECILLLGHQPKDFIVEDIKKRALKTMDANHIRILLYNQIIDDAYSMHKEFIENKMQSSKLLTLLQADKKDKD